MIHIIKNSDFRIFLTRRVFVISPLDGYETIQIIIISRFGFQKLIEMSPFSSGKVFFGLSGSDSNDTQYKLFTYANNKLGKEKKKKMIARKKGYHGVTVTSASMTGLPNQHKLFDLPQENFIHTETPHYFKEGKEGETEEDYVRRLSETLEKTILDEGPESIAAMIAEPLMGAGGVILPPKGF